MLKKVCITLAIGLLLAPLLEVKAQDDVRLVIITGKDSSIEKMDRNVLRDVFSGKLKYVKEGVKAILGFREEEANLHEHFCQSLMGISPLEFKKSWARRIFAGSGSAPSQIHGNDEEVKRWVSQNLNGISYILEKNVDASVKVISDRLDGKK